VARDAGDPRDPQHHTVDVAAVDRPTGHRPQDEGCGRSVTAAGLEGAEDWDRQGHGGRLGALADQVQHPVASKGVGIVLDPDRGGLGRAQCVDPQQVGQGAMVHGEGFGDLKEPDQLEPVPWVRDSSVWILGSRT